MHRKNETCIKIKSITKDRKSFYKTRAGAESRVQCNNNSVFLKLFSMTFL